MKWLMDSARKEASAVVVISLQSGRHNPDWAGELLNDHTIWVESAALPGSKQLTEYAQAIEKVVREALAVLLSTHLIA